MSRSIRQVKKLPFPAMNVIIEPLWIERMRCKHSMVSSSLLEPVHSSSGWLTASVPLLAVVNLPICLTANCTHTRTQSTVCLPLCIWRACKPNIAYIYTTLQYSAWRTNGCPVHTLFGHLLIPARTFYIPPSFKNNRHFNAFYHFKHDRVIDKPNSTICVQLITYLIFVLRSRSIRNCITWSRQRLFILPHCRVLNWSIKYRLAIHFQVQLPHEFASNVSITLKTVA